MGRSLGYPVMFRAGDILTVRMTKEGLAAGRDPKYPLRDYHGQDVVVIAQRKKGEIVRDTYPDEKGLVDVSLPFPFMPAKDARPVWRIPILYSALQRKR